MHYLEEMVWVAYYRKQKKPFNPYSPEAKEQQIHWVEHAGKTYAVIQNVNGILAVYQVRNDYSLKEIDINWFKTHVLKAESSK